MNLSVQNKQNKKDTFQQSQILTFWWFFKTWKFFLKRIPHKNFQIDKGRVDISKKIKVRSQICLFLARNSQNFEKDYRLTVLDKTLISNIPKIQTIPWRNEGVIVFFLKFTMRELPGIYRLQLTNICVIRLSKVNWLWWAIYMFNLYLWNLVVL